MTGPTFGSLFSGYGGLELGLQQVFGGRVLWHCENATAPSKVLARNWPGVPNLGDIRAVDWSSVPRVDVLTGGFPCQDVSTAGRGAGLHAGTRSGLWSYMAEAVDVLRPALVVIENVRGLRSADASRNVVRCPWCMGDLIPRPLRALGAVLADLAAVGYDAWWERVRASDAGAAHERERIFVFAYAAGERRSRGDQAWGGRARPPGGVEAAPDAEPVSHGEPREPGGMARAAGRSAESNRDDARPGAVGRGRVGDAGSADRAGRDRAASVEWGPYAEAVARWEALTGPHPWPVEPMPSKPGRVRLAPVFVEWLMGLPPGFVTDPALGLSRTQQLQTLGNGVVPQQAALAARLFLTWRYGIEVAA